MGWDETSDTRDLTYEENPAGRLLEIKIKLLFLTEW